MVDHGLRAESGAEAALTIQRLHTRRIAAELLVLTGLRHGPALAARARAARHTVLAQACARHGILHLLLGHHAADQAETLEMRHAAGSGPAGLTAMAALREITEVRILRPLLTVPPGLLRHFLRSQAMPWIDDPSNTDAASLRIRLRQARADSDGSGPSVTTATTTTIRHGKARQQQEADTADELAARARILPEGYAVLTAGPLSAASLAALLRIIGGRPYAPSGPRLHSLAAHPQPATLAGVRLLPAGRIGPPGALLMIREQRAIAPPITAAIGATWDNRFRLTSGPIPLQATLGAVGNNSPQLRDHSQLPAAVLATLPAVRVNGTITTIPHLDQTIQIVFTPPTPAACAGFQTGEARLGLCP